MLASILCCPFFVITANNKSELEEECRLLLCSMAREVRLARAGYTTRFVSATQPRLNSMVRLSAEGGREGRDASAHVDHTPRDSSPKAACQSGRVVVEDVYIGQVDEQNWLRCGVGMAWIQGRREIYLGEWRNDKPHGWGALYSTQEEGGSCGSRKLWAGEWVAGKAASSPSSPPLPTGVVFQLRPTSPIYSVLPRRKGTPVTGIDDFELPPPQRRD